MKKAVFQDNQHRGHPIATITADTQPSMLSGDNDSSVSNDEVSRTLRCVARGDQMQRGPLSVSQCSLRGFYYRQVGVSSVNSVRADRPNYKHSSRRPSAPRKGIISGF